MHLMTQHLWKNCNVILLSCTPTSDVRMAHCKYRRVCRDTRFVTLNDSIKLYCELLPKRVAFLHFPAPCLIPDLDVCVSYATTTTTTKKKSFANSTRTAYSTLSCESMTKWFSRPVEANYHQAVLAALGALAAKQARGSAGHVTRGKRDDECVCGKSPGRVRRP